MNRNRFSDLNRRVMIHDWFMVAADMIAFRQGSAAVDSLWLTKRPGICQYISYRACRPGSPRIAHTPVAKEIWKSRPMTQKSGGNRADADKKVPHLSADEAEAILRYAWKPFFGSRVQEFASMDFSLAHFVPAPMKSAQTLDGQP